MALTEREILHILVREMDIEKVQNKYPEITRARVEGILDRVAGWGAKQSESDEKILAVQIYVDGAASSATEQAGIGVHMLADGKSVASASRNIGRATNNEAEYQALLEGLKMAKDRKTPRVEVFTDSELVANQINGSYRVKSARLRPLHEKVIVVLQAFEEWSVRHIPREQNKYADVLAKNAAADDGR